MRVIFITQADLVTFGYLQTTHIHCNSCLPNGNILSIHQTEKGTFNLVCVKYYKQSVFFFILCNVIYCYYAGPVYSKPRN